MYFLYNVLLGLGFAVLLPKFLIDAWRHGKYVTGLRQRLGFIKRLDNHDGPLLWLHCVSVGETQAALPLLRAIRKDFPHYRIVASTTTVTGQELAREIFKDVAEQVFFFPIDWSWTVKRTLRAIEPAAVVLMETELWPAFLRECHRRRIPAVMVNGRISEKSFARYRLVRSFVARVVNCLDLAMMQTEADANRIRAMGLEESRVLVSGNMKFDAGTTGEQDSLPAQLASRFGLAKTDTILAASTHDPEERLIVEVFRRLLKQHSDLRLIIAPRHPERFAEVAALLNASNIPWRSRTATPALDDESCRIILLDTIGELKRVLPLSRIVFVGGSIAAVGGHNVLEPAAEACAIVTGPHTANFQEIVTTFLEARALIQLADLPESEIANQLTAELTELLSNREQQTAMGERARKLVEENRGATARTVKALASTLRSPALSEETNTKQLANQGLQST
jgi:3-deoxy-D-manno-octulosonic-acid transferase